MTDTQPTLQAYITAARQMSEVTGEDLLEWIKIDERRVRLLTQDGDFAWLHDTDAISILRDRVWGAVRGWVLQQRPRPEMTRDEDDMVSIGYYIVYGEHRYMVCDTDLPSAVAAIHKHWKQST